MLSSLTAKNNKLRKVAFPASSYIKMSNNVKELNVVSTLTQLDVDRKALRQMSLGTNVEVLQESCFCDCLNLQSITSSTKTKSIGSKAFYNCASLTSFTPLDASTSYVLNDVGTSAFAGTGFKSVYCKLSLSSSSVDSFGSYLFAGCKSLNDVSYDGPFVPGMFEGCTSLTNIQYSNANSIPAYLLKGCTSLKSFNVKSNASFIDDECFAGCTQLTSVGFEGNPPLFRVGDRAFNGTSIATLTLPQSITSFNQFSDYAFAGMSKLTDIYLNGMSIDDVAKVTQQQTDVVKTDLQFGKMYTYWGPEDKNSWDWMHITPDVYNQFYKKISFDQMAAAIKECKDKKIPFTLVISKRGRCSQCESFYEALQNNKNALFKNLLQQKCIFFNILDETTSQSFLSQHNQLGTRYIIGSAQRCSYSYVLIATSYKNPGDVKDHYGYVQADYWNDKITTEAKIQTTIAKISQICADFSQTQQTIHVEVKYNIFRNKFFGLNHNVNIHTRDGQVISYNNSEGATSLGYVPPQYVDDITVDNFKYGQWYSNATYLKEFADNNHVPVFAIATPPLTNAAANKLYNDVFKSQQFQSLLNNNNFLLCKVTSQNFSGNEQPSFLYNIWMSESSDKSLPLMMMYYNEKDGKVNIQTGEKSNAIYNDFAQFNESKKSSAPPDCPSLTTLEEVIGWINKNLSKYQTAHDSKFDKPAITFHSEYPKYKVYSNQLNDTYGRYYPVAHRLPPDSVGYKVTINNTEYVIDLNNKHAASLPSLGTYQCFTTEKDDVVYDRYGCIFQIGKDPGHTLLKSDSYEYLQKTFQQYVEDNNLHVASTLSTFFDDIYVVDEYGQPTLSIDTEWAAEQPFLYNITATCQIDNTTLGSKHVDYMDMWLSSEAKIEHEVDEEGEDNWRIAPSGTAYVVSAQLFTADDQPIGLQWLSGFVNDSIDAAEPKQSVSDYAWSDDWESALENAKKTGTPLVAVWTISKGCHFCDIFKNAYENQDFINWAKSNIIFTVTKSSGWSGEVPWITGKGTSRQISGAPGVHVYWEKDGQVLADQIFMGRLSQLSINGKSATNSTAYIGLIYNIENILEWPHGSITTQYLQQQS